MGQISIYLPDEVERRFRLEVRRRKTTMSAYVASLGSEVERDAKGWPEGFAALFGSLRGELESPPDPPPEAPRFAPEIPRRHRRVRRLPRRR